MQGLKRWASEWARPSTLLTLIAMAAVAVGAVIAWVSERDFQERAAAAYRGKVTQSLRDIDASLDAIGDRISDHESRLILNEEKVNGNSREIMRLRDGRRGDIRAVPFEMPPG